MRCRSRIIRWPAALAPIPRRGERASLRQVARPVQAVGVEATGPNSPGWSRGAARSLRQSPPSASISARSASTLPVRCRARPGCPRPAQRSSSPGNPSRSASSTSSAAPACPTNPSPSAVTSSRVRGLVACTRKVPSLTGDRDLQTATFSPLNEAPSHHHQIHPEQPRKPWASREFASSRAAWPVVGRATRVPDQTGNHGKSGQPRSLSRCPSPGGPSSHQLECIP